MSAATSAGGPHLLTWLPRQYEVAVQVAVLSNKERTCVLLRVSVRGYSVVKRKYGICLKDIPR
ncbi:hypothetical protein Tco_1224035, partial [Tanacetum coccineum]